MNPLQQPAVQHRPMQMADLDAVMVIEPQCYEFPWTRGNFVDSLAAGHETELALDAAAGLIGYRVAMVGVDEMHLLNLAVHPAWQGRGHAHLLLLRLLDDCRRLALATLWLEVRTGNQRAHQLYQRWGFREVGLRRAYYPAAAGSREDAVVMRLLVPPQSASHALD